MTLPGGGRDGEAWIEVHADTDRVEPEIERGVKRAAEDAESDIRKTGNDIGDTLAEGISADLKTHGKDFQESIEKASKGHVIRTQFGWRDRNTGRFVRSVGDDVEGEIEQAFSRLGRPGGPISTFGQGIADAIGAGFNISGKSPLVSVLAVAILAIVGAVLAAVQAVSALAATLLTLPALLTAIGLQFAVFKVAFSGIGDAIQGAFAAKNWQEFEAAVAGLTPSAQRFVKSLMPAKQLFKELKAIIQENFFASVGDSVGRLIRTLDPILRGWFGPLASRLGDLFRSLTEFFGSRSFQDFLNQVFPATLAFLERFGPDFVTFLKGLIDAGNASMGFLTAIGNLLSTTFAEVGYFLQNAANDPEFQQWLLDMEDTLESIQGLFFGILGFVRQFAATLNEAGGKELIDTLTESLGLLTAFLATDAGKGAMEGLVQLGILGIKSFVGLVLAILIVIAALRGLIGWLGHTGEFFEWLGQKILDFFTWVGQGILDFFTMVGQAILDFFAWVGDKLVWVKNWVVSALNALLTRAKALPGQVLAAIGNLGKLLVDKGRALLDGLIQGIKDKFAFLRETMSKVAGIIGDFLPGSPAKEGPLSGKGYSLYRGQALVDDFARGIKMEAPTLKGASVDAVSNIVFGPNSVRVGFEGVVPSPEQARITGSAAGQGILNMLAARNTRLAVRTL